MGISVEATGLEVIGKIKEIGLVDGKFGSQIQVTMQPADPNAANMRMWWFPNKPPFRANSKWIKFIKSFDLCVSRNTGKAYAIKDSDEMLGHWVTIEDVQRSGIVQGEPREWTEPVVKEVFENEAAAMAAWSKNAPAPVAQTEPAPAPRATIEPAVVAVLKSQWDTANHDEALFWPMVQGWGYSKELVMASVKDEIPY